MRTTTNEQNRKQGMVSARMMGMRASWFRIALAGMLALVLLPSLAKAFLMGQGFTYTPVINPVISSGHVMARAQVVGPNGGPILVKVRSSGAGGQSSTVEVEEIGEAYAGGPLEGVYVLSGSAYRDVLRQLAQLRARYPERMARAEFLPAQQLASGLSLADGSSSPGVTLPDHIKTVVVWGRQDRLSPETDTHILLTAPFQLDAGTSLAEDVSSLLMNPDGSIRSLAHGSGVGGDSFDVESFTWRTAFYAQPGSTEQSDRRVDRNEDTIFGPISNAILEQIGWFGTMYAVTDADGYYFINSPMLCMRNSYGGYLLPGMDTNLILTVPTVPFNPNRLGIPPYFEIRDIYAGCSDSFYPYRIDFLIDVLWLVGELHLSNTPGGAAIPVGSSVSYEGQDRTGEPTVRVWDYDGDGESDRAILADKLTVTDPETGESFVIAHPNSDGQYQAVYFSSGTRSPDADALADRVPDLWRLADRTLDGRPTGLLTEISEDALRHTDVYIFRESTGELLVEVSGLPEGPYAGRASRIENNAYLWHTLLRGRESVRNNFAAYGTSSGSLSPANEDAFRERSAELGFSSRYQSRDADMPAPGEMLHVVAINRVTGYTGSVRFELGAANSPGGAQQRVPRLELLPPNVKVWAQRLTEIEAGLTAGEQREYLISHEGAHTANDLIVGLYTEWRAADGSPLPNALGQLRGADFGLTGRLAKVRDGQLVPVTAGQALDSSITLEDALTAGNQGAVAEFPIGPGQNLQLLRLPNTETGGNEHYYVNLFGRALNKEVCSHCQYDQAGLHPTLAGRPNHFAPVSVPRYDQARTDALRLAARELAEQSEEDEEAIKVDAQYLWMLRPEYQFSQIDFRMDEIIAEREVSDGPNILRDLLFRDTPIVTSSDDILKALFSLVFPDGQVLDGFDGLREYVLAVGDAEIRVSHGKDGIEFDNLEHLSKINVEDMLSLRVYLNHDPENILWKWAFEYLYLDTEIVDLNRFGDPFHIISADETHVDLQAALIGYSQRKDESKDPVTVIWQISEGQAMLAETYQTNADTGTFFNQMELSTLAGTRATVRLSMRDDMETYSELGPFIVVPGAPSYAEVSIEGEAYVMGHGEIEVTVTVYDQWHNRVADGTTVDIDLFGDILFREIPGHTENGVLTGVIAGNLTPGEYQINVGVGGSISSYPVIVRPLSIHVEAVPSELEPLSTYTISATVTDDNGVPVPGAELDVYGRGIVTDANKLETDSNGNATITVLAGRKPGESEVALVIGYSEEVIFPIDIKSPDGAVSLSETVIVGDSSGDAEIVYDRFDATRFVLPFDVSSALSVSGFQDEGPSVEVTLGSLFEPNRQPLSSFPLSSTEQRIRDQSGLLITETITRALDEEIVATAPGTRVVSDSRFGSVGRSMRFDGTASVRLPANALPSAAEPAFRIELKPTANAGALLDYGPLSVSIDELGRILVNIDTSEDTYSVKTAPVQLGAWQRLGVAISAGTVSVHLEGQEIVHMPYDGSIAWRAVRAQLGGVFVGNLRGFLWYDAASNPLVVFSDGSSVAQYQGDPLSIVSTATLNHGAQYKAPMHHVGVYANSAGSSESLITLVSSGTYSEVVGTYAAFFYQGVEVPPINWAYTEQRAPGFPITAFFGVAHASLWDRLVEVSQTAVSAAKAVADFLILNDLDIIYTELGNLLRGDDVDWTALAFSIVTIIPAFRALKVVDRLGPSLARAFRVASRNSSAMLTMGRTLNQIARRALSERRLDQVIMLAPFVLVLVEIAQADEDILDFIMSTMSSVDEVLALMELFNMPEDGWEGDEPPPRVELDTDFLSAATGERIGLVRDVDGLAVYEHQDRSRADNLAQTMVGMTMSSAHASRRFARGFAARSFATGMRNAMVGVPPATIAKMRRSASGSVRALVDGIKSAGTRAQRKALMDSRIFVHVRMMSTTMGVRAVSNILRGFRDIRVPVPVLVLAISYIEMHFSRYEDEDGKVSEPHIDKMSRRVLRKYGAITLDAANGRRQGDGYLSEADMASIEAELAAVESNPQLLGAFAASGHGEVFHLVMLAYYLALSDMADAPKVKAIEAGRSVWLFDDAKGRNQDTINSGETAMRFARRVDIVLADGDPSVPGTPEQWVELKSYKSRGDSGRQLTVPGIGLGAVWNLGQKKPRDSALHRQFIVDRLAKGSRALVWPSEYPAGDVPAQNSDRVVMVDSFDWRFQSFRRNIAGQSGRTERSVALGSPRDAATESILGLFNKNPVNADRYIRQNAGLIASQSFNVRNHVKTASVVSLFKDALKNIGLEDIIPEYLDVDFSEI